MKKEFPKRDGEKRPRRTSPGTGQTSGFRGKTDQGSSPRSFAKKDDFRPFNKKPFGDKPFERKEPRTDSRPPRGDYKPRENGGDRPYRRPEGDRSFNRDSSDSRPPRGDFKPRENGGDRPYRRPEGDRPFNRDSSDSRPPRGDYKPRENGGDRPYRRPEGDRPFNRDSSDSRPPRGDFKPRENGGDRPYRRPEGDRPFNRDSSDSRPPRGEFKPRENGGDRNNDRPKYGDRKPFGAADKFGGEKKSFDNKEGFGDKPRRFEGPYQPNLNKDTGGDRYNSGRDKYRADGLPYDFEKRVIETNEERAGTIRLNRYIANSGICSRRDADELIAAGQIYVNNEVVTEMGYQVKAKDVVKYGKKLLNREKMVYLLVNKPKDYITTTEDPQERKTIMNLVEGVCKERIYPVGRLDRNTTGLILLTNDGELAAKLTHPSYNIEKTYQVELDKAITDADFEAIKKGITLEDGEIKADGLAIITPDAMVIGITIHSGKNHIVRRIFAHLGYDVLKLDRTVFAGLNKKDLPRGKWRLLGEKEIIKLKYLN